MTIKQLEKDLETVRRALNLTPEQQKVDKRHEEISKLLMQYEVCLKAVEIYQRIAGEIEAWKSQPEELKRKSPLYEEWCCRSPITKDSYLIHEFATPEERDVLTESARLYIKTRNKLCPQENLGLHRYGAALEKANRRNMEAT